ncbi:MAG: hypothetical protein ACTTKH_05405 [Treponema sp.]
MDYKNYSCNDAIDRDTCILSWDEKEDKYKIGKHIIPSLNEIVFSLIGVEPENLKKKNTILNSLRYFLLTGEKKKDGDIAFLETEECKKEYAVLPFALQKELTKDGFYKDETEETIKKRFAYTKKHYDTNTEINVKDLTFILNQELIDNVGNPEHIEEIARIEELFSDKIIPTYVCEIEDKIASIIFSDNTIPKYEIEDVDYDDEDDDADVDEDYDDEDDDTDVDEDYDDEDDDADVDEDYDDEDDDTDVDEDYDDEDDDADVDEDYDDDDYDDEEENIVVYKKSNCAWFSQFEMVNRQHYHLAKKQNIRENLFFAARIDLCTADTLYYIETENKHSIDFIILYLNILNMDLKKEHLKVLFLTSNGSKEELELPKMSERDIDELIISYKSEKPFNYSMFPKFQSKYHNGCKYSEIGNVFYSCSKYIKGLLPNNFFISDFGFSIYDLIPIADILFVVEELKNVKAKFIKNVLLALDIIKKIFYQYGVEYVFILFNEIKDQIQNRYNSKDSIFKSWFFSDELLKKKIEDIKKRAKSLGSAYKHEDIGVANLKMQMVQYKDVTLELRISKMQRDALFDYLKNNLITKNDFNSNDKNAFSQIISIKEKKKLISINGSELNIAKTYKKQTSYMGVIQAEKYIHCKISQAVLFKNERPFKKAEINTHLLVVTLKNYINEESFNVYFEIVDMESLKNVKTKKEYQEKLTEFIDSSNANLTLFFDTFSIKRGNFDFESWIGKTGIIALIQKEGSYKLEQGKGVMCLAETNSEKTNLII